jgi:hypothetical protein
MHGTTVGGGKKNRTLFFFFKWTTSQFPVTITVSFTPALVALER